MELTLQNYHTLENRYLTNSRIKDWLLCKQYFHQKHIEGMVVDKSTDALKIGSAVDTYVFFGKEEFRKKFIAVSRRNIKNPPINITELTEEQYEAVREMAIMILSQPAFKEMADHEFQKIITIDMDLGEYFTGLAAIPDAISIKGDTAVITDLKTAMDADDRKYHYKCLEYGYYRQFAVMKLILENNYNIKNFIWRHLICEKNTRQGVYIPYVYYLSNEQVDLFVEDIKKNIIPVISSEKEFLPKIVDWVNVQTIGEIDEEF